MVKKSTDDKFFDLARDTVGKAEAITCSFHEFVRGLKIITDELKDRLALAQDELEHLTGEYHDT